MKRWIADIKALPRLKKPSTSADPDQFTGLFVTNFSWHYDGQQIAQGQGESLLVLPDHSKHPLQDQHTIQVLFDTVKQYGLIPHDV